MSLNQDARTEGRPVEAARRGRSTTWRTRMNRALFSTDRWPWLVVDMMLVLALYELGIRLSPYGGYRDLVSPYAALSVVYAIAFGAVSLGLGSYDRDNRFDYFAILRSAFLTTSPTTTSRSMPSWAA